MVKRLGVTRTALASHLDCTVQAINDYRNAGIIALLEDGSFDQDASRKRVLKHLRDKAAGRSGAVARGGLDLSEERAKLARQQSEAQELKNAIARAEYVRVDDVAKFMEGEYSVVREHCLTLPVKVADRLAEGDPARRTLIENAIRDEVHEALSELSHRADLDFTQNGVVRKTDAGASRLEATGEADADRVGGPV